MKKQTAVEWLINQLPLSGKMAIMDKIEQAKEMEKQQISEAYRTGVEEDVYSNPLRTGEIYYNQTFK